MSAEAWRGFKGTGRKVKLVRSRREAELEARLMILRSRARSGARSMQDRGTGSAARDAAGTDWAQTRQEAEKVERELQALRGQIQEPPKKAVEASRQTTNISKESNKALSKAKDYPPLLPEDS